MGGGSLSLPYLEQEAFGPVDARSRFYGFVNDSEFIVIERDGGEGSSARFKRIYKLDLRNADADGTLRKDLLVDLMQIGDPDGITAAEAGAIGLGEVFKFPFVTIESVYPVGAHAAGDQR